MASLYALIKACRNFASSATRNTRLGELKHPTLFEQQLPLIREVLGSLRIPMVELEGYEADDLLATLTKHFKQEGFEVVIVTGDRDILQLVGEGVSVIMTRRGISDVIRYDNATVLERYGVTPEQWTTSWRSRARARTTCPAFPVWATRPRRS